MEPSLYRYIWQHSSKSQIFLIFLSVASLPLVYITLELPKQIINLLEGTDGFPSSLFGYDLDRLSYLMLLSFSFLLVVLCSGGLKYILNVYRGSLGEHVLRRFRYELYERVLRFPVPHFKRVSQGEMIPMITAETEPLGEFIGESYTLPVFQGGILATYLFFIFQQDVFLGLAAIALYPFQLYVIPKLQRRVNELAKQRVATARDLSGRIGETISGINEVHANDTSHFERAHIGQRLGRIYLIRFDIYKRKFFIKFLNNFIAQLTPFFFYSVGGYFVLRGDLSIGSMVAVLVAYKDLSGTLEGIAALLPAQGRHQGQVHPDHRPVPAAKHDRTGNYRSDSGIAGIARAGRSMRPTCVIAKTDCISASTARASAFRSTSHSAAVGLGNSGKDELAFMMSRLIVPSSGSMTIGDARMNELPEAITGKRLGYVGPAVFLFNGSVYDNLCYGLKHQPVETERRKPRQEDRARARTGAAGRQYAESLRRRVDRLCLALGIEDRNALTAQLIEVLKCVELDEEVYQFGLLSFVDQADMHARQPHHAGPA